MVTSFMYVLYKTLTKMYFCFVCFYNQASPSLFVVIVIFWETKPCVTLVY